MKFIGYICLLAISAAQPSTRGRVRIAGLLRTTPQPQISYMDSIKLPNGFKPQLPPENSLLYPLNLGEIPPTTVTQRTHIPLLRATQQLPKQIVQGPTLQDTIIYGNWKTERPVKPIEFKHNNTKTHFIEAQQHAAAADLNIQRTAIPRNSDAFQIIDNQQATNNFKWLLTAQNEHIAHGNEQKYGQQLMIKDSTTKQIHALKVNNTYPMLVTVAKQIHSSFDTVAPMKKGFHPTVATTENTWIPIMPTNYIIVSEKKFQQSTIPTTIRSTTTSTTTTATPTTPTTPSIALSTTITTTTGATFLSISPTTGTTKVLPSIHAINFNNSTHSQNMATISNSLNKHLSDYKYYADILNLAQMNSELNIPESLMPELPLNITGVGVPFERRNSAEESTICVPLTVNETAVSSGHIGIAEAVQVERVYCFPLPLIEVRHTVNHNQTTRTMPANEDYKAFSVAATCLQNSNLLLTICIINIFIFSFSYQNNKIQY